MARKRDSLAHILSCAVCFEDYDDRHRIPRLLPCSHSLCEPCITDLIESNTLKCPICRKKHRMENKEKSFPQNEYILILMRAKSKEAEKLNNEKCEKHGKELTIFCCEKVICLTCLRTEHEGHKWIEIEERKKEALMNELNKIKQNLEAKIQMISDEKMHVAEHTEQCVKGLEKTKEDFVKTFDEMIREAIRQRNESRGQADEELSAMRSNIELLNSILDNLICEEYTNSEVIQNYRETVQGIIENNKKRLSGTRSYEFPVFNTETLSTRIISERITKGGAYIVLPDYESAKSDLEKNQHKNAVPFRYTCTYLHFFNLADLVLLNLFFESWD